MSVGTNLNNKNTATRLADEGRDQRGRFTIGNKPKVGFHTNPERRSSGHWKKSDSARYKLERMMLLTEDELQVLMNDSQSPLFEQKIAEAIMDGSWSILEGMMNQVYGSPRSSIDISAESSEPLIKGFVIPVLPDDFINLSNKS